MIEKKSPAEYRPCHLRYSNVLFMKYEYFRTKFQFSLDLWKPPSTKTTLPTCCIFDNFFTLRSLVRTKETQKGNAKERQFVETMVMAKG